MNNINEESKYYIFKYLWLLAFIPKPIQMITLLILTLIIFINIRIKLNFDIIFLGYMFFLLINFISGIIYYYRSEIIDISRLFAFFNMISVGVVGCLLYLYYSQIKIDQFKVWKYMYYNINILFLFSTIFFLIKYFHIPFPNYLLGRKLWENDWIEGLHSIRLRAFLEYDGLVVWFVLLNGAGALKYIQKYKRKFIVILYPVLMALPIYFCGGRTGIIIYMIILTIIITKKIKSNYLKLFLIICFSLILIFFVQYIYPKVVDELQNVINAREGSTTMRLYLYSHSISKTLNESPLIGIGIKTMVGKFPLGSHSSYIGWFYKAGFIGLLGSLFFMIGLFKIILRSKKFNSKYWLDKIFIFAIVILMLTSDLDGSNWSIVLFFSVLGILKKNIFLKSS